MVSSSMISSSVCVICAKSSMISASIAVDITVWWGAPAISHASADVVHGFWVPEFLFKRDVLPDPKANNSDNIFQVSEINQTGAFVGRCTEMCGTYHSMMNFELRAVSPEEFDQFLAAMARGASTQEALVAIGENPIAVTTSPFDTKRDA